jgi:hypothetical protein
MFQNLRKTPALNEQPGKGCEFSTAAFSTERERVLKHMVLRASLLNSIVASHNAKKGPRTNVPGPSHRLDKNQLNLFIF